MAGLQRGRHENEVFGLIKQSLWDLIFWGAIGWGRQLKWEALLPALIAAITCSTSIASKRFRRQEAKRRVAPVYAASLTSHSIFRDPCARRSGPLKPGPFQKGAFRAYKAVCAEGGVTEPTANI